MIKEIEEVIDWKRENYVNGGLLERDVGWKCGEIGLATKIKRDRFDFKLEAYFFFGEEMFIFVGFLFMGWLDWLIFKV